VDFVEPITAGPVGRFIPGKDAATHPSERAI
jgi:hypothetical protein